MTTKNSLPPYNCVQSAHTTYFVTYLQIRSISIYSWPLTSKSSTSVFNWYPFSNSKNLFAIKIWHVLCWTADVIHIGKIPLQPSCNIAKNALISLQNLSLWCKPYQTHDTSKNCGFEFRRFQYGRKWCQNEKMAAIVWGLSSIFICILLENG